MDTKSVVICGVGGQGIILASEILSFALFTAGFDVKKNEIHGMSQRGGSVISFIRWGGHVYSPVPAEKSADILFSFEKLEAMRNLSYLKADGQALVNDLEIMPVPVKLGAMKYPENFDSVFSGVNLTLISAEKTAKDAGNPKSQNVVMLGALSRFVPELSQSDWEGAIHKMVKPQFIEVNLKAFEMGKSL